MLKVALTASALLLAALLATAADGAVELVNVSATEASCHSGQPLDLGCAMRAVDADGDGTISAIELANLAVPLVPATPIVDWTPLHSTHGTSLDFKDAAIEPGTVLPTAAEHELPQPLIPALFALGALVILLRRRPS
jgi:hypothetical protein